MPVSRVNQSWRASLIATLLAPIPVLVMIYLVETHTPADSTQISDFYPVGTVMFCLFPAAFLSVVAVVTSIYPIFKWRLSPLIWITFLVAGWCFFISWYDWHGLFNYGKAWVEH